MGLDLKALSPAAAAVYATVDRVCGLGVGEVIASGPLETLTTTLYAQPAVVATSLAALTVLRERLVGATIKPPAFCAGHSVGELAAYAAAGACSVATALTLVARRSQLMAAA